MGGKGVYHAHELEDSTLQRCQFFPNLCEESGSPNQNYKGFFVDLDKLILNFIENSKDQASFVERKNKVGGTALP